MPSVATSVADAGTIGCDMTINKLIVWCWCLFSAIMFCLSLEQCLLSSGKKKKKKKPNKKKKPDVATDNTGEAGSAVSVPGAGSEEVTKECVKMQGAGDGGSGGVSAKEDSRTEEEEPVATEELIAAGRKLANLPLVT